MYVAISIIGPKVLTATLRIAANATMEASR